MAGMSLSQDVWVSSAGRSSEKLVPQAPEQPEAEGAPRIKPGPDGQVSTHEAPSAPTGEDMRTGSGVGCQTARPRPFMRVDLQVGITRACLASPGSPS